MGQATSKSSSPPLPGVLPAQPIKKLSVVIPALNEAEHIQETIDSVYSKHPSFPVEIIVVDGGSTDATVEVAHRKGAKVLSAPRGRGLQLNVGWHATDGDWLLFLHADTTLPIGYDVLMKEAILKQSLRGQSCWGCFRSIDTDLHPPESWLLERGVSMRTTLLHQPYGDQGIFVSRQSLSKLQGFKEWPLLEDVELVGRLNKLSPPAIVPAVVKTSGRRWMKLGFWQTMAINQKILIGWRLGVPVETLASWYRNNRRT